MRDVTLYKTEERSVTANVSRETGKVHIFKSYSTREGLFNVVVLTKGEAIELAHEILEEFGLCDEGRCWRGPGGKR